MITFVRRVINKSALVNYANKTGCDKSKVQTALLNYDNHIYRHNISAKNKINMFPFTYSEFNVQKLDYICELCMENNDDMVVVVQHSCHYPIRKIFI